MRRMLIGCMLLLCIAVQAQAKMNTFSGYYRCSGILDADQTPYKDVLLIIDGSYTATWTSQDKTFIRRGKLMPLEAQAISLLGVFWQDEDKTKSGMVYYRMGPNHHLDGQWVLRNATFIGSETCEKLWL